MEISTSILNADDRIEAIVKLNRTNHSYVHVDVMDGNFVSDIQFNVNEIRAVNVVSNYPLDVHLMVDDPMKYINKLDDLNIKYITFHVEIKKNVSKIISKIKELGYGVGLSIKPDTDIEELVPYINDIDMILVMSVEPGKGGQKFIDKTIDRIKKIKKIIAKNKYNIKIEVDGGIDDKSITMLDGVDIAVVGSYIIKSDNYSSRINKLLKVTDTLIKKDIDVRDIVKSIKLYKFWFVVSILLLICNFIYWYMVSYDNIVRYGFFIVVLVMGISLIKIKNYKEIKKRLQK